MGKHENTYCSRCKVPFICNVEDIANCQCSSVQLSTETTEFLTKTFYDCLCKKCLAEIEHNVLMAKEQKFPTDKFMFIEGAHYYKQNNYWVFTEIYHMLRGQCCENGCRHCVYGFDVKLQKAKSHLG